MKYVFKALTAGVLLLSLTSCSLQDKVDREIQLPIYETDKKVNTAAVSVMDLEESVKTAAALGYATADSLTVPVKSNLVTYNAVAYQAYKQGDLIAAFDSSELDYEYKKQSIYTEAAMETYLQQGTESAKLEYEYQKALLDQVEYRRDCYNVYAPFDCIVTDAAGLTVGQEMEPGEYICAVAPANDIFVYIGYSPEKDKSTPFKLGAKVTVTLTGKTYDASVISMPKSNCYNHPLKYSSYASSGGGEQNAPTEQSEEQPPEAVNLFAEVAPSDFSDAGFSYSKNQLGLASKDYFIKNTIFGNPNGGPTSADSSRNIIIGFEPQVLAELLEETPNAVRAGWATVGVVTKKYCNVLALPEKAVTVKDTSYVYLYKDGQRIQTPVTVGDTVNGYTIILEGLREGDEVAY